MRETIPDQKKGEPILASELTAVRKVVRTFAAEMGEGFHGFFRATPMVRRQKAVGTEVISFRVLAAGPFLGEMALECDSVVAQVLNVSCGGSSVSVGDEVTVWDPSRCYFNMPIEMLIGALGRATRMVNDMEDVVDCYEALAEEGRCKWEVLTLCCTEEIYGYP